MELGLVLTLCGLGVAFWIPALIIAFISHGKKKNCTMNTIGLVIRINSRSSGDSGLNFYPVPHTAVGQFPSMITQDSGRIHLYLVFQSFFLYESTHHFFCRRRPANVTEADKKYSFHI